MQVFSLKKQSDRSDRENSQRGTGSTLDGPVALSHSWPAGHAGARTMTAHYGCSSNDGWPMMADDASLSAPTLVCAYCTHAGRKNEAGGF